MSPRVPPLLEIRDPIHGAIGVDKGELAVIDHPVVQRLRGIRQLGFSHLPFPGATHTRYTHSLGAMHLAGQAFDACFRGFPFSSRERRRTLRRCLRLAALCHDLGHPPFSHAVEFAMPPLRELDITAYRPEVDASARDRRASHEDYTISLLLKSGVGEVVAREFGFTSRHVASLISQDVEVLDDFFVESGHDLQGLLSQLVSSDLDVDRMDYLVRDATFTGARYGEVDVDWLLSNISWLEVEGRICLALDQRAIYAFHDFMLARLHMFLMVYFHRKSVIYEEMLKRFMSAQDCPVVLPADVHTYIRTDDSALWSLLRQSDNPWARRVVEFRPYRMVHEVHGRRGEVDLSHWAQTLEDAGLDVIRASTQEVLLTKPKPGSSPIYVVSGRSRGRSRLPTIHDLSDSLERYRSERTIDRLYVDREMMGKAQQVLDDAH